MSAFEIYKSVLANPPLEGINTFLAALSELKLYFRFEETSGTTVNDSSAAGNNGTASRSNILNNASGKFGKKGVFVSASSDKITITNAASLRPTGAFTIGYWMKTSTTGTVMVPVQFWSANTAQAGITNYVNSNKMYFRSGKNTGTSSGTDFQEVPTTTTITDGYWHFIVCTWDGNNLKIYCDGRLEGTQAWTNAPAYAATTYIRVGCANDTGTDNSFWNGDLDDLFLLNGVALDAGTIRALYGSGLLAYYRLESNFTDSSGNGYDLTTTGTPGNVTGVFGNGKSFVINTSYASIADASFPKLPSKAFSISGWVYPTNTGAGWQYIASKRSGNNGWYLALNSGTTPYGFISDGTNTFTVTAGTTVSNNNWYHVALTYDGVKLRIYVNGKLDGETAATISVNNASVPFYIACNSNSTTEGLTGQLDDIAVFNKTLSADEVKEIYEGRRLGEISVNNLNIGNGREIDTMGLRALASLVAYWKLEGNSNSTVGSYNGTDSNVTYNSSNGKFGQGAGYNGTNSKTTITGSPVTGTGNFTVSAWIKSTMTVRGEVLGFGGINNTNQVFLYLDSDGKIKLGKEAVAGAASAVLVNDGQWHHVAATCTSGTIQMYVDGVASGSTSAVSPNPANNNTYIGYGHTTSDFGYFNGAIDDVAMFNVALTAAQIKDIYLDRAGLQGLWHLNNGWEDASGNNYHLTPTNSPTIGAGKLGNGMVCVAASSRYATLASPTNMVTDKSQTWMAWVKFTSVGSSIQRIFGRSNSSIADFANIGLNIHTGATPGKAACQFQGLTTNTGVESDVTLVTGVWYHIVGIWDADAGKIKLWVNGLKKEVSATGLVGASGTQSVSIGRAGAYNGDYLDGTIDECAMWTRALSDKEVRQIYARQVGKFQ